MGEKLKIGDFGTFRFEVYKKVYYDKGKFTEVRELHTYEGMEVKDVDAKAVLLKGPEDDEHIIERKRVKSFTPERKKI